VTHLPQNKLMLEGTLNVVITTSQTYHTPLTTYKVPHTGRFCLGDSNLPPGNRFWPADHIREIQSRSLCFNKPRKLSAGNIYEPPGLACGWRCSFLQKNKKPLKKGRSHRENSSLSRKRRQTHASPTILSQEEVHATQSIAAGALFLIETPTDITL